MFAPGIKLVQGEGSPPYLGVWLTQYYTQNDERFSTYGYMLNIPLTGCVRSLNRTLKSQFIRRLAVTLRFSLLLGLAASATPCLADQSEVSLLRGISFKKQPLNLKRNLPTPVKWVVTKGSPIAEQYTELTYRLLNDEGGDWSIRASSTRHLERGAGAQWGCILFFCAYFPANIFEGGGAPTDRLEVSETLIDVVRTWRITNGPMTFGAGLGVQLNNMTLTGYSASGASVAETVHALPVAEVQGELEVLSGVYVIARRSVGTLRYNGFRSKFGRTDLGARYQLSKNWAISAGNVDIQRLLFEPKKSTLLWYPSRFNHLTLTYKF